MRLSASGRDTPARVCKGRRNPGWRQAFAVSAGTNAVSTEEDTDLTVAVMNTGPPQLTSRHSFYK